MIGGMHHRRKLTSGGGGTSGTPPTITNLTGSSNTSTTLNLTWTYNAGTTGVSTPTFTVTWSPGSSANTTNKSYQITGLTASTSYTVTVSATITSAQGNYNLSQQIIITTAAETASSPSAPSNLTATPKLEGPPKMILTWGQANGNGAPVTAYKVERSINLSTPSWSTVATVGNVLTYTISDTQGSGRDVLYRVSASNGVGGATTYGPSVSASAHEYTIVVDQLTTSGTWTAPTSVPSNQLRLILVAGGGGGGAYHGAGGGGGGEVVRFDPYTIIPGAVYQYAVGAGGPGGIYGRGTNGFDTTFGTLKAKGGGGGGGLGDTDPYNLSRWGADGGSGGGGSRYDYGTSYGTSGGSTIKYNIASSTIFVYGNDGSASNEDGGIFYGGGGGGATSKGGLGGSPTSNVTKGGSPVTWNAYYNDPNSPNFQTYDMGAGGDGHRWSYSGTYLHGGHIAGPGAGGAGNAKTTDFDTSGEDGTAGIIIIEYYK